MLEQYRQAIEPLRRLAVIVIPVVLGLLAGSGSMGAWRTFLLWANREPFGVKDPQFGLDIGFFVFTLPWLRFVVSFVTVVLVLAFVAGAFTHYVYGGLQLPGRGPTTRAAYVHLGILGALIALTRAASYWLDRYSLATEKGSCSPASPTPTTTPCCPPRPSSPSPRSCAPAFFLAAIWSRSWRLPITGVVLLVVTAVVVGGAYPALIQSLRVQPSEKSLEAPYIERNIVATRTAFGLNRVKRIPNPAATDAENQDVVRAAANDIPGVRIIDPNVVAPTFRQLEGQRDYYAFPDTLDVDRYTIDEQTRDAVVAVREINLGGLPDNQRNWLNDHTVYTHGYGFYAAYGNQRSAEGDPVFFEGGGRSSLGEYEPRIYFGELSPTLLRRRRAEGRARRASSTSPRAADGDVAVNNTYAGHGGVADRLRPAPVRLRREVPRGQLPPLRRGQRLLADPRPPHARPSASSAWPRGCGSTATSTRRSSRAGSSGSSTGSRRRRATRTAASSSWPRRPPTPSPSAPTSSRSVPARSTTSATPSRRRSTPTTAASSSTAGTPSDPMLKAWSKAFPGLGAPAVGDLRRADVAHPLPAGPAQGAARAASPSTT